MVRVGGLTLGALRRCTVEGVDNSWQPKGGISTIMVHCVANQGVFHQVSTRICQPFCRGVVFGGGVGPMLAVLFQHFGQRRIALIDASQFAVGAFPLHLLEWRCGKMSLS